MNRRTLFLTLAIAAQFLVLGWMAGQREWILRAGPTVWLRTAPVDPRDLFRGDYVSLDYEIARLPTAAQGPGLRRLAAAIAAGNHRRNRPEETIYAALTVDADGRAQVTSVDTTPPTSGLFIQGRCEPWLNNGQTLVLDNIDYGIDAYYVEQGKGLDLERGRPPNMPDEFQFPLEMAVALGRDGTAVLHGHRWPALGSRLKIVRPAGSTTPPPAKDAGQPAPAHLEFSLCNGATTPIALALPHNLAQVLSLTSRDRGPQEEWNSPLAPTPVLAADELRILQPGEQLTLRVDLQDPRWFVPVKENGKTVSHPLGQADSWGWRLIYNAPPADCFPPLPPTVKPWAGTLSSRAFSSWELR